MSGLEPAPEVSVVVPVYNECESIPHLLEQVAAALRPLGRRFEIILVDDGSSDASWQVIRGLTPEGAERVIEADAFEARALLHELDHLDGLLFLDRVSSHESLFRRKVYK